MHVEIYFVQGDILVDEVRGAASGVLRTGDRITKINEVDLAGAPNHVALETLRSAQDKVSRIFLSPSLNLSLSLFLSLSFFLSAS